MAATAEDVRAGAKKTSVLVVLDQLGSAIRHKQGLVTHLGKGEESEEIKTRITSLKRGLSKDIHSYIDACLNGLKEGAILHDPFDIVYDHGFEDGTYGQQVACDYLKEIMSKDDGFLASVQLKDGAEKKYSVAVVFSNGVRAIYNAATSSIGYLCDAVMEWIDLGAVALTNIGHSAMSFWHWLMAKISAGWNKVKSLFSKSENAPEAAEAVAA